MSRRMLVIYEVTEDMSGIDVGFVSLDGSTAVPLFELTPDQEQELQGCVHGYTTSATDGVTDEFDRLDSNFGKRATG